MKTTAFHTLVLSAALALSANAQAQDKPAPMPGAAATMVADMTEGEIRKVDKGSKKITIKHGDIKNLDMPGMTMVFRVQDDAMLDQVKAGDKVKFVVERSNGAFVVTQLQATP